MAQTIMTILWSCMDLQTTGIVELPEEESRYRIETKIDDKWSPVMAHSSLKQAGGYATHNEAVLMAQSIQRMMGHKARVVRNENNEVVWWG